MAAAPPPPAVARLCGKLEQYSTARHCRGWHRGLAVVGRLTPAPDPAQLLAAVAAVVNGQPMLRVGIAGEDSAAPAFVHVAEIDLGSHVKFETIEAAAAAAVATKDRYQPALIAILQREQDSVFPDVEARPPWDVIACRPAVGAGADDFLDVIFVYHHAIGDGMSGPIFHQCLRDALDISAPAVPEPLYGSIIDRALVLHTPDPQPSGIVPDVYDAIDLTVSWWFFLREVWNAFAPAWLRPAPAAPPAWSPTAVDTSRPHRTRISIFHLPAEAVASLVAACRRHRITLTPLVQALILAGFVLHAPAGEAPAFEADTTISMRRWARPSFPGDANRTIAVLNTGLHHRFGPEDVAALRGGGAGVENLAEKEEEEEEAAPEEKEEKEEKEEEAVWAVAARVGRELVIKLDTLPRDDRCGLIPYWPDVRGIVAGAAQTGRPRPATWELINLTAIEPGPDSGRHSLTRLTITSPALPIQQALSVHLVGIRGGELTVSLTWNDGDMDEALVGRIARDLESRMLRMGSRQEA